MTNFQALESCDVPLSLCLLKNRALRDAACRYLLQQLRHGRRRQNRENRSRTGWPAWLTNDLRSTRCRPTAGGELNLQKDLVMETQAALQEVGGPWQVSQQPVGEPAPKLLPEGDSGGADGATVVSTAPGRGVGTESSQNKGTRKSRTTPVAS